MAISTRTFLRSIIAMFATSGGVARAQQSPGSERLTMSPGEPFDFGRYRIVEAPLDGDYEADPLIGMTRASQVFGLSPDAVGLWSNRAADALAER